jgi:ribosomal protein L11 methyltransferase
LNYFEFEISILPYSSEISEILIAELAEVGFESFSETPSSLLAYIPENLMEIENIKPILTKDRFDRILLSFTNKTIPAQNWNALWESNFDPIFIEDKILVRAPFHTIEKQFEHEIVIEPKMSFGTGHHETTALMMEQMLEIDFNGKVVLDMGCGTGILAILASQLGAKNITAIDYDEWAYENSIENFKRNNCNNINAILGDASAIPAIIYQVILANINRNVLLTDISAYSKFMNAENILILSGFYSEDMEMIVKEAALHKLLINSHKIRNNWTVCVFKKQ